MGLDVSHDAFHGAYSAFDRFRRIVTMAMGPDSSWSPHDNPDLDPRMWYADTAYGIKSHPGLTCFLNHSDCDGEISPEMCKLVADDLEGLLPAIEALDDGGSGHIERDGGYAAVARKFIAGCRAAHEAGEALEFG